MLSGDIMNNKGFTLVEILAAIVILGLVMGIAVSGVTSTITKSKEKSEEIFVGKFKDAIIEYLDLYGMMMTVSENDKYQFNKCIQNNCYDEENNKYVADTYYEVNVDVLNNVNVRDLISEKILAKSSIVNPANKKECFDGVYPDIKVFRDDDFVYYFYVDLNDYYDEKGELVQKTTCEISPENAVINTIPNGLLLNADCSKLDNELKKVKNELIDKFDLSKNDENIKKCV